MYFMFTKVYEGREVIILGKNSTELDNGVIKQHSMFIVPLTEEAMSMKPYSKGNLRTCAQYQRNMREVEESSQTRGPTNHSWISGVS